MVSTEPSPPNELTKKEKKKLAKKLAKKLKRKKMKEEKNRKKLKASETNTPSVAKPSENICNNSNDNGSTKNKPSVAKTCDNISSDNSNADEVINKSSVAKTCDNSYNNNNSDKNSKTLDLLETKEPSLPDLTGMLLKNRIFQREQMVRKLEHLDLEIHQLRHLTASNEKESDHDDKRKMDDKSYRARKRPTMNFQERDEPSKSPRASCQEDDDKSKSLEESSREREDDPFKSPCKISKQEDSEGEPTQTDNRCKSSRPNKIAKRGDSSAFVSPGGNPSIRNKSPKLQEEPENASEKGARAKEFPDFPDIRHNLLLRNSKLQENSSDSKEEEASSEEGSKSEEMSDVPKPKPIFTEYISSDSSTEEEDSDDSDFELEEWLFAIGYDTEERNIPSMPLLYDGNTPEKN